MSKPKSAYSIPGKKQKNDTHVIVVWVDNEAGVLARVVGLFSGRGYNIESLAVAEVDPKLNISRITIVTTGTPQVIEQIKLQLGKLVPVHKVADFMRGDKKIIFKEMALLKIVGNNIKAINFTVYDRWGNQIFQSTNKDFVWSGDFKGKPCNSGVYAYIVNVEYTNGGTELKSGNITLIR